ncbi:MAG: TonB-dependent receptor [Alteromonadaceae bacterium]|nr:TonB-dependent receptor [Alteromonadaceae bacterium]
MKSPLARCIGLALASYSLVPVAQAQSDDEMLIRVTEGQSAEASRLSTAALASEPAERLASDSRVSLSRLGGRGLDPVIHGQSQERVDVLLDGMRVEGACPNRMDPPTSRLSSALPQVLEVRTSNQTLRWGAIAGGQVIATTAAPEFGDSATTGHVTLGGSDNGDGVLAAASAAVGNEDAYMRLSGGHEEANDYEDGDGDKVPSAFENTEGRAEGFWRADNGFYLKGSVSRQEEQDVKYASMMDAPKTDTDMYKLEIGSPVANGDWSLLAWQADVDHVMDNFSLREPGMMKMETLSETRTQGARLVVDQVFNYTKELSFGVDVESNEWDATLWNVGKGEVAAEMWPEVERDRIGVFVEGFHQIRANTKLGAGIRYDRVEMQSALATQADANDDNVSGFLSGEWRLSSINTLEAVASHSIRSPGVNERYINRSMMWKGNPDLETEKHHKLEVALRGEKDSWQWRPGVWIDEVDDYVLRYQGGDSSYKNIDARLLGVEAELGWSNGTWSSTGALTSVRGYNNTDNRDLPQIPPIMYTHTLGWQSQGHSIGAEWQLARRQERIDEQSGLDPSESPGYGVFNLNGNHPLTDFLSVSWAVDNVFDKDYAPHVSREDSVTGEGFRVNEPGRTFRAAVTARW